MNAPGKAVEALETRRKNLEKQIAEQEQRIASGDLTAPGQRASRPGDPVLEPLLQKLYVLRGQLAEARKMPAEQKAAEALQREIDQVNKLVEERKAKLASGNIEPQGQKMNRPSLPGLEEARQELAAVNKQIADARKAANYRTPDEIALQAYKVRSANRVAKLKEMTAKGDFATKVRKPLDITKDPEAMRIKAELAVAKEQFAKGQYDARQKLRTVPRKIWDGIKQTAQAYGNIFASFDFSAPRQAIGFLLTVPARMITNPVRTTQLLARSFGRYFTSTFSEKQYQINQQKIHNRPNALSGADKEMGINYSDMDSHTWTKYEDAAHSVLDEWALLPIRTGNAAKTAITVAPKLLSKGVRGSNRGFSAFLNSIRAGFADELLRTQFKDRAPTPVELRDVGYLVNLATGRGELGPRSGIRYLGIWSPHLLMSRVKTLTGAPFLHAGSARTKAIVTKEYAKMIMGGFLLFTVSRMFDDKREKDPASSDWAKIVRGATRLDMFGGYQQVTVAGYRIATATIKTLKGDKKDIGATRTFGVVGPFDLASKFYRSKLRPDWALMVNLIDRKDYIGRNMDVSTPEGRANVGSAMVPIPLAISEIRAVMKDRGFTEAMIDQALALFGSGLSTYEEVERQR
jgi:hypothetical protein